MNGADIKGIWQTLQPDWPIVLLGGTIILLIVTLLAFLIVALLLRRSNDRKARQWSEFERDWGELLGAVTRGEATSADVKAAVGRGRELHFVDYLYKQALRTEAADQRALLSRLAMPYLSRIAARTKGGDPERRARAVKTLGELGLSGYLSAVVASLDDPSPLVSMSAARVLAGSPGAPNVQEIVSRLDRFGDWNSRFLRSMLMQLGDLAAPGLRESAMDETLSPRIRAVCLDVLGHLEDEAAGGLAHAFLESDEDVDMWASALRVLRRCPNGDSLLLIQPLCDHPDPVIRAQAIGTLARLGDDKGLGVLESALHDSSPWVVMHAARGLKQRGRTEVLERALLMDETEADMAVALQVLREED